MKADLLAQIISANKTITYDQKVRLVGILTDGKLPEYLR
jgi:hypothetical protein